MEFYLRVRRLSTGGFSPAGVTIGVPDEIQSNERLLKIDLEITPEAFDYPSVKIVWPEVPTTFPPGMVENLRDWTDGKQP